MSIFPLQLEFRPSCRRASLSSAQAPDGPRLRLQIKACIRVLAPRARGLSAYACGYQVDIHVQILLVREENPINLATSQDQIAIIASSDLADGGSRWLSSDGFRCGRRQLQGGRADRVNNGWSDSPLPRKGPSYHLLSASINWKSHQRGPSEWRQCADKLGVQAQLHLYLPIRPSVSSPAMAQTNRTISLRDVVLAFAILSGTFLFLSNTLIPFRPQKPQHYPASRDHFTRFTAEDLQVTLT